MRHRFVLAVVACAALLAPAAAGAQSTFPADSTIRRIVEQRVEEGRSAGIAVGLIEPDGTTRFLAAGSPGAGRMPIDRQSVFEIGSITKVFTGVLLADMARTGDVALDDPVSKYLPEGVTMPSRGGKQITLAQLSMQNSGLPRLPGNMRPSNPLDPYADYTVAQLYEFLSGYTLTRDPGERYEYSNLGVGLLGHALARAAGTTYEALVTERILEPLGMEHTGITLTPWMQDHVVAGHNPSGDETPLWHLPTLAGAGAMRSTMDDMLTFVEAHLRGAGPLHQSMQTAIARRAETGSPVMSVGLGWHRRATGGDTIVWHNGGTGGFRAFAGFDMVAGTGVVVLTNSGGEGADDVGFHLLAPDLPLNEPQHRPIDLPASVMERYVGTYELTPQMSIVVTREGDILRGLATGQSRLGRWPYTARGHRLWPYSETEFFLRDVDVQITFEVAPDGTVSGLVLHQNGRDTTGRKAR